MRALLAICLMSFGSCAAGTAVHERDLDWIEFGTTTRTEVVERFGPPDEFELEVPGVTYRSFGDERLRYSLFLPPILFGSPTWEQAIFALQNGIVMSAVLLATKDDEAYEQARSEWEAQELRREEASLHP